MLFDKTRGAQPFAAGSPLPQPVDDLRKDLGLVGTFKVNRVERKAKTGAAEHLVRRTVAIACDVAEAQMEVDATNMKTALMARAVPVLGGLLDELVVRTGHVRLGFQASEHAGIVAEIESRYHAQGDYEHLHAIGHMSESELVESKAFIAQRTTDGCMRLVRDVDRAHEALDAHLGRVVDHVKEISKKGT